MSQKTRILIAIVVIIVIVGAVLGIDAIRRQMGGSTGTAGEPTSTPGAIPIILDGKPAASFNIADASRLTEVSFVDAEEGKEQRGWLLRDVLLLYINPEVLTPDTIITVTSSSRQKSARVTWSQVEDTNNMVMFDLSNRGTLKLVSKGLPGLATRNEWVQDVDKIDITTR